jgi:hypothetical protein
MAALDNRMGRIRTIRPDFFLHDGLFDLESNSRLPLRLAFAGLWTQCDREGRFKWRPRRLKPENLMLWIQKPQLIVPNNTMSDMGVSEQDSREIAAYLYTLR